MKKTLGGILLGLVVALPAMAAPAAFPAPKDAVLTEVGRDMQLNGVNMSAWDLRSQASPATVLKFYRDLWATGGPTGGQDYAEQSMGPWQILTHVDDGMVYTVQVQAAADKKGTEGLLGISDVLKRKPTEAKNLASDFPKPAGSVVQNDLTAQDQGVLSRTIVMRNPSSVQHNLDFYVSWFADNGWTVEDGMRITENDHGTVVASRGGNRWQLSFTPQAGETSMVAVLEER